MITANDMYEVVTAENDCLVIVNLKNRQRVIFNSWLEWHKLKELVEQFEDELIPF